MVVVAADDAEAVGEVPHLHRSVGAAGEDVIGRPHLDLHDARAQVPEQRLAGVFVGEGVEQTLGGQVPHLRRRPQGQTDRQTSGPPVLLPVLPLHLVEAAHRSVTMTTAAEPMELLLNYRHHVHDDQF